MFKFGCHKNNEIQEYYYSDLYDVEQKNSYERIVIGLAQGHINTGSGFNRCA